MKIYNSKMELIEKPERESEIAKILDSEISFVTEEYDIDEQLLRERSNS